MSTPKISAAPSLPSPLDLDLDAHTGHFFFPNEHSAPVDARFKLDIPAFKDMVLIGRVARFCTRVVLEVGMWFERSLLMKLKT